MMHPSLPEVQMLNWFPGHMKKTLGEIRHLSRLTDVVIEVRDARIPLTCFSPVLDSACGEKKRIVLLHKASLVKSSELKAWRDKMRDESIPVLITDKNDPKSKQRIFRELREISEMLAAKFRRRDMRPPPARVLVAGLPNTGKSTVINMLLGKKRNATGNRPGITRTASLTLIRASFEIYDTPGVFPPRPESRTAALKLAAAHCIRDERLDFEELAWFLADFLAKEGKAPFVSLFSENARNENRLRQAIAELAGTPERKGKSDPSQAYRTFVRDFRSGKLGRFVLDKAETETSPEKAPVPKSSD